MPRMSDFSDRLLRKLGLVRAADVDLASIRAAHEAVARYAYLEGYMRAAHSAQHGLAEAGENRAVEVARALLHIAPAGHDADEAREALRKLGRSLRAVGVPLRPDDQAQKYRWTELPLPRPQDEDDATRYPPLIRAYYEAERQRRRVHQD